MTDTQTSERRPKLSEIVAHALLRELNESADHDYVTHAVKLWQARKLAKVAIEARDGEVMAYANRLRAKLSDNKEAG